MVTIPSSLRKLLSLLSLVVLAFGLTAAQAQFTVSEPLNGGTLSWTLTDVSSGVCGEYNIHYMTFDYTNFAYTSGGKTYPLAGSLQFLTTPTEPNSLGCPSPGPTVLTLSLPASFTPCVITFTAQNWETTTYGGISSFSCVGYLDPKYVVVGVTYAPPGPGSFVQYTGTSSVGNTTTISSTFANDVGFSVSATASVGAFGEGGSITGTESTDYTQGSNSSTTNTLSKLTSLSYKTSGTGNAFSPVNHDYDTIWLWINPVVVINFAPPASGAKAAVQWKGYGFDVTDPAGQTQPDVVPIQVGWLNGHFGSSPSINAILARSWQSAANGFVWASGQGPGLTSTDIASIIAADPLASSSYTDLESFPSTTADGRFTLMEDSPNPFFYEQAGPGNGGGTTEAYSTTQTNTQSVAKGTSTTFKQAFSLQEKLNASVWVASLMITLTESDTITLTSSVLNTLTTTTTLQDALSITGPGCPQDPGPCSPVYAGPGQFLVYQDNQFGTFAFVPVN
jgi:hypothetical protein